MGILLANIIIQMGGSKLIIIIAIFALFLCQVTQSQPPGQGCQPCYDQNEQKNCQPDSNNIEAYTLHMAVHPHLDAFWIFDFESYYNPNPNQGNVRSYFASNRFHSVKQIFDTTFNVLTDSRKVRENQGAQGQKAHRSFFNSEMGFFKRWYYEQTREKRERVKELLKTKYWEILGGAFVEHDEGCAYYDDIIQNFQVGLRFLKEQIGYYPRVAVSADSFGHSQSTLAILAHLGIEGFFVERSDEHILLKSKTEFIWKAKSSNGRYYGALPTHIRWAIHGFEDQFIGSGNPQQIFCQTKAPYIGNMNRQNEFLKRILKSDHIMRYFGHDFQQFDDYSYSVMQGIMEKFSMQKCKRVNAVYSNPTEYFMILMGEVFGKSKPIATREEDIMPIWDYDSGLYWTGYYTTDPFHKKQYRDVGRFLYAARKAFTPSYISDPNSQSHKLAYRQLQQLSQTVAYLQHHDGISGTSKYQVMDKYEKLADQQMQNISKSVLQQMFEIEFPNNTNNPVFECFLQNQCFVPQNVSNDVYLKIFKTGGVRIGEPIVVHLKENQFYEPDCQYEIVCMCTGYPCACDLYLYPTLATYSMIRLKKVDTRPKDAYLLRTLSQRQNDILKYNKTHILLSHKDKEYAIGYKRLNGDPTSRNYAHLSRYGDQVQRSFSIRSGKYALGNNVKTEVSLSSIRKVLKIETDFLTKYVILWAREQMKTIITISKLKLNQWKVQTLSSAESGKLEDLYLEINAPHVKNNKKFYTDSNGWLVMQRELFKHEDYEAHFGPEGYDDIDGNSYPMTAFVYITDQQGKNKVSVNTDRPQGVIAFKEGTIWINYDRLTSDDGKWVYENTYRSEYQKFVHYITVDNQDNNERTLQKLYDEPLLMQGNSVAATERVSLQEYKISQVRMRWQTKVGLEHVKFQVKPWNDSSLLLRVFNMRDSDEVTIQLFSADRVCTFLTAYYGNQVQFTEGYETNMGGNIRYEEFIKKKWNWNKVVNLNKENEIFNKNFGETIVLRPLQIRTFVFEGIKIKPEVCRIIEDLKYNMQKRIYQLDTSKPMPARTETDKENEKRLKNYLLHEDDCNKKSPINDPSQPKIQSIRPQDDFIALSHRLPQGIPSASEPGQPTPQSLEPVKPFSTPSSPSIPSQVPPPQPTRPVQPLQPQSPPSTELTVISQKIKSHKTLTKSQKELYFNNLVQKVKKIQVDAKVKSVSA